MYGTKEFAECLACSCFAARRTARMITQHYERQLKSTGLGVTQFTLLAMLSLGGPQPLSRFADQLGVERTTLTRNLRPLIARGLVIQKAATDGRVRMLAITPRGRAATRAALPRWREAQESIATLLGPTAVRALHLAAQTATRSRSSGSDSSVRGQKGD